MGTTDEWGELQVLMPEFGEFDASPTEQAFIITAGEVHQARTKSTFVLIVVTAAFSISGTNALFRGRVQ